MRSYLRKYFYVLGRKRRALAFIFLLFMVSSLFDLLGIGLIGPFVSAVVNPEMLEGYPQWQGFKSFLGLESNAEGLVALGFIIIACFCLKGVTAYWIQRVIFNFSFSHKAFLINGLMTAYQARPLKYHLEHNSASLMQAVSGHVTIYTDGTLVASLRLAAEVTSVTVIIMLLAITDITTVLAMCAVLFFVFLGYDKFVKRRVLEAGRIIADAQQGVFQGLSQAIDGYKEIRVLGREKFFHAKVDHHAQTYADTAGVYQGLKILPRYLIESVMIIFVVMIAIVALSTDGNAQAILPVLSMFGVAAIRLMPSSTQILGCVSQLRNANYALSVLYRELSEIEEELGLQPMMALQQARRISSDQPFSSLKVNNITFYYDRTDVPAVKELNMEFKRGQAIGLIGHSGSGKTTLVDILLGLLDPQRGHIEVDGVRLKEGSTGWLNHIAYLPQIPFLIDDTIKANVALGVPDAEIDDDLLAQALEMAQLDETVAQQPAGVNTVVGERGVRLSGGQRQRIALARAFYHQRDVLILDEATAALDNKTEEQVISAINRYKGEKTLIVIAHRLSTVRHCDVIYKMERGPITQEGVFDEVVGVS